MSTQLVMLTQPGLVRERLYTFLLRGIVENLSQPEQHDTAVLFSALEMGSRDGAVASLNSEYHRRLGKTLVPVFIENQRTGELNNKTSVVEAARGFMAGYYGLRVLNKDIIDGKILEDVVTGLLIDL